MVQSLPYFLAALGGCVHFGQRPTLPSRAARSGIPSCAAADEVTDVFKRNWCEKVDGANNLAVVLFHARWCRTCKAVTPIYKRMAHEYPEASFFRCDFKRESELCYQERVFSFPVVHFYVPGIGRVARCVLTKGDAEARLRHQLGRFLCDSDGQEPAQLQLLKQLNVEALQPFVHYKEMVSALRGLSEISTLESAARNSRMAGLRRVIEGDERLRAQLEALFQQLDRDADGKLTLPELEATVAALRPGRVNSISDSSSDSISDSSAAGPAALSPLLERMRDQAAGVPLSVDLPTFVRLMTAKAAAEYTAPEREFRLAFEALDEEGSGAISQRSMLSAVESFCSVLPGVAGCDVERNAMLPALGAFANEEAVLTFECYMEMVSGRNRVAEDCEIDDSDLEQSVGPYQSIFGDV